MVQDVEYYVEGVPDPEARFNLTLWLAARGSEPERLGRVREALRIAAQAGDRFETRAMLTLHWSLTESEQRHAVGRGIRHLEEGDSLDTGMLAEVVLFLTPDELEQLAGRVARLSNRYEQARGFALLAGAVEGDRRKSMLTKLHQALEALSSEERPAWHRAEILADVAIFTDEDEASELLDEVEELSACPPRPEALPIFDDIDPEIAKMFKSLSGDERVFIARGYARLARARPEQAAHYARRAFEIAADVKHPGWALDALDGVARTDAFPTEIRRAAASRAFFAAARLDTRDEFLGAVGALASEFPPDDLPALAARVQMVGDAHLRHDVAVRVLILASQRAGGRQNRRCCCERRATVCRTSESHTFRSS